MQRKESSMEQSTRVITTIKQSLAYSWTLFWSPLTGAVEAMSVALNHPPQSASWKELVVNDIHLYLTPLTGAIRGVRKALKSTPDNKK
jgi:hypothetical protein